MIIISSLLSSGSKLAVLVQSESAKEHGKGSRPGVVAALIGDITRGHAEVNLSQVEGGSVQGIGLTKWKSVLTGKKIKGLRLRMKMRMRIGMRIKIRKIEQEEEDQVVEEEDSELSDMTYSVIEVLESEVILEVMPRVVRKRTTRSGRALE